MPATLQQDDAFRLYLSCKSRRHVGTLSRRQHAQHSRTRVRQVAFPSLFQRIS